MKSTMKKTILLSLSILFLFAACNSGEENKEEKSEQQTSAKVLPAKELQRTEAKPVSDQFQKESTATTEDGLSVELYRTKDSFDMRYNPAFFRILDSSGAVITNADLFLQTYMDMGQSGHGAPVLQPTYRDETQLYEGGIVFSMPGKWDVHLAISNGQKVDFTVPITYLKGSEVLMEADNGEDDNFYSLSLMSPRTWKKGDNNFSVMVNLMEEDMVSFPPVNGLSIEMTAVNATADSTASAENAEKTVLTGDKDGIYTGTVQLPDPGLWNLSFELKKDGKPLVKEIRLVVAF